MKGKLVLLLFALPFAGVGVWAAYSIGSNLHDAWQMRSWAPITAQLENAGYERHSGDDSTTYEAYATYRYRVAGQAFSGNRVGVAGGADNIGDYQVDTGRRLSRQLADGESITIYYDPASPGDSVIDRHLRWAMVGFKTIFLLVFGGVGFGLIAYVLFARADPDPGDPRFAATPWLANDAWQTAEVRSGSKLAMAGAWVFAAFWNLVSAPLPFVLYGEVVEKQNYPALLGLLFPAVGAGLLVRAVRRTLEWTRFGPAPVRLDPFPGAIGGHVGGTVDLRLPYDAGSRFDVTLTCVESCVTGRGKNRSRREKAAWQDVRAVSPDPGPSGTRIVFRFDVPEGLEASDALRGHDRYHLWRLSVRAALDGADFDRDYDIPVYPTGERSSSLPEPRLVAARARRDRERDADLHDRLQAGNTGVPRLHMPAGRNLKMSGVGFLIGSVFAAAGWFLVAHEGEALFGSVFGVVGILLAAGMLYAALNSLTVTLEQDTLVAVRRILGVRVSTRRMRRDQVTRLCRDSSFQAQSGGRHVMHYTVRAIDAEGRKITLGEGFRGIGEAEAAIRLIRREFSLRIPERPATDAAMDVDILAADN